MNHWLFSLNAVNLLEKTHHKLCLQWLDGYIGGQQIVLMQPTGAFHSPPVLGNAHSNMTTQFDNQDSHRLSDQVAYDPNNLLDSLIEKLHLKNDAALSRALEVAPPVISKIRHRRLPVGASLLIRMHEVSNLSIRELRVLMGDRREKFRISDKQFKPKHNA